MADRREADTMRGFTWVELLVVIAIILMLALLLLPAREAAREAARRLLSKNNLKNQALAAHNFHDENEAFPAGTIHGEDGDPMHGWVAPLLPHLELDDVEIEIDFNTPWDDENNAEAMKTGIFCLRAPSAPVNAKFDADGYALMHYAANRNVIGPGPAMTIDDITDGPSNTLLFGEARANFKPWGHPANYRDAKLGINASDDGFGGFSPGGASFALCDGSVRFLSEEIAPEILKALSTPNGGEGPQDF